MKRLTKEWVAKAQADYLAANVLVQSQPAVHDAVCFHAQQTAEKYLKALLEEAAVVVPRTHDLGRLLALLLPLYPELQALRRGLVFLTNFAVDTRYPGENASKRQSEAALRWALKIRTIVRNLLGVA